jgi:hypothetical protein
MRTMARFATISGTACMLAGLLILGAAGSDARAGSPTEACDPLDPALCLLPFPNDLFTAADAGTDSGRRVAFAALPTNAAGQPIDPTEWNRNDGFSPGSPVLTFVPELDLHVTWGTQDVPTSLPDIGPNELGYFDYRDHIAAPGRYLRPDAPIVILDATTGERHPFWSELDQHPATPPNARLLILRPAVNFEEGHRYIVALRNLKRADGSPIAASAEFEGYRSGSVANARSAHMESLFTSLEAAGIDRDDLYLCWDFTVASERNISERSLHIRDDAFAGLGDVHLADRRVQGDAPAFEVTSVEDFQNDDPAAPGYDADTRRRVRGIVRVPNYLGDNPAGVPGGPGSRFYDADGDDLPDRNPDDPELEAVFVCDIPYAPFERYLFRATPLLYGHGLLGSPNEVTGGSGEQMRRRGFMTCATPWIGMAQEDVPNVVGLLQDLSGLPTLVDRAQQGFLNFHFVGRAMVHPQGFASDPAFRSDEPPTHGGWWRWLFQKDRPLIRAAGFGGFSTLVYDGNSQGAIMGGAYMALSPDAPRGVLGVAGMNYSTLLNRSVDWEASPLSQILYGFYPDKQEQQLLFAVIQMLWDRAEANGYAHHMTGDPLPNTPAHGILMHVAFGDHQVTNVSAEVEARTMGARLMRPPLEEGKHWEADPYFTPTARYPRWGSAMVYWDSGNATPPNANIPADHDGDPHEDPRREPGGALQKDVFLHWGLVIDVCDGQPYRTDDHPDSGGVPVCDPF